MFTLEDPELTYLINPQFKKIKALPRMDHRALSALPFPDLCCELRLEILSVHYSKNYSKKSKLGLEWITGHCELLRFQISFLRFEILKVHYSNGDFLQ